MPSVAPSGRSGSINFGNIGGAHDRRVVVEGKRSVHHGRLPVTNVAAARVSIMISDGYADHFRARRSGRDYNERRLPEWFFVVALVFA